jgi:hypothetical protein
MRKAGPQYYTIDQARAAAQGECDAYGIDPTWSNIDRCTRLIDIQQGSPLMHEERVRRDAHAAKLGADKFHTDLKAKLGQESFNDLTFKSVSVADPAMAKLITESEDDRFLGDIVKERKTKSVTGFFKGSEVVGFAVPRKDSDGRYRTGAIFVSKRFQQQGIAGEFVKDYFADKPGRAMIETDNTKSQKLFESNGFKRSGKTIRDSVGTIFEVWLKD